ncbi:hypothetical protein E4T44_11941 [Aureobasidium sp. EXF-8845]|nr:hypothetical protein E4T44_11941 [Aureobasidium sp. EXF-8845]
MAFRAAAIEACDSLDGLTDGIVGAPGLCQFDPHTVVGKKIDCDSVKELTAAGATIAQAAWTGPIDADGKAPWFGVNHDALLRSAEDTYVVGNGSTRGKTIPEEWISLFIKKDPAYDTTKMTDAEFFSCLPQHQMWVEEGIAPNTLRAFDQHGKGTVRELCQYPLVQRFVGGDPKAASSFECS